MNNRRVFYSQIKPWREVMYTFVQRCGHPSKTQTVSKRPAATDTPHAAGSALPCVGLKCLQGDPRPAQGAPQKAPGLRDTFHRKP